MTFLPIQCDNCGAKYKLPESFSGSQAKCQKCGSVIDVAGQRAAGAAPVAPAAAKPAAARPATAKPAAARPAVERSAKAERPARAGKGRAGKDDGDDKPARGARRGRGDGEAKKSNSMPLILGGVGLVAVVVVVVLMMNKGDKPDATDTAANNASKPAASQPAEKPAEKPVQKPAEKPAEQPAAQQPAEKPAEKPADAAADKPTEKPAEASKPTDASAAPDVPDTGEPKLPWQKMRNPPQTMDQVTDPKSYPEIQWPASVDDATKGKIRALLEDVAGGGVAGIRAKPQLLEREIRFAAMFGVVEKLRTLNYRDTFDSQVAFELNKVLEEITAGLNARFAPVEATEDIHPAKAEWNTRTVNGWIGLLGKYPDEDTFQKDRAERVKKQAEENK